MPQIKLLDTYIERSALLLEAQPTDTHVSITYHAKPKKSTISKSAESAAYSFISFKTFHPQSGACYAFKTSKSKDLSRILAALGPRGVQFTKTKRVAKDGKISKDSKPPAVEKYIVNGKGFASLLSNKEFSVDVPETSENAIAGAGTGAESNAAKPAESASKKKKNKKKKGKK